MRYPNAYRPLSKAETMPTAELVEYLEDRAGEYLRGVARYRRDSTDVLYLREDIRRNRLRSQIDRMLKRVEPEATAAEERAFPFGDLYVTVRRFEEAIVMHFPTGNRRGVLVALEPDTARDLNTFTTECLDRLADE